MASCNCMGKRKGCTCSGRCACECTCTPYNLNPLPPSFEIEWEELPVDLKDYPWDLPNLPPNCS